MHRCNAAFFLVTMAVMAFVPQALPAGEFPLKDGDIWVMAGDSITAQHLHSNYFEAFCFARYPKLKFAFRNSGVGGHTIPTTLARFEYDIAAWKPTIVSVELGMNDSGGTTTEKFIENMETMLGRIRSINARPVILSASPVNDGTTMKQLAGRNIRLSEYAAALKSLSAKENVPYADQFHALVTLWGENKPREILLNSLPMLKTLAADGKISGADELKAFLAALDKSSDRLVSLQGDPVHPGPPGQLMMAAALLKELGAEPFVSSAAVDAGGKILESKGCRVEPVAGEAGPIRFSRLDECLPLPVPDDAATALGMLPAFEEISQYLLQIKGLAPGAWVVILNGAPLATTFSSEALDKGVNLTQAIYARTDDKPPMNPLAVQARAVLAAVAAKEQIVGQWRSLSQRAHAADAPPELKQQLPEMTKKVELADEAIRKAAQPQKLVFEIVPRK